MPFDCAPFLRLREAHCRATDGNGYGVAARTNDAGIRREPSKRGEEDVPTQNTNLVAAAARPSVATETLDAITKAAAVPVQEDGQSCADISRQKDDAEPVCGAPKQPECAAPSTKNVAWHISDYIWGLRS